MSKPMDLSQIKIATPCPADWNKMKGDDRVRFCGDCKLNVYSSAGLTQEEVMDLVQRRQKGERICMQLHRRVDGTLITKDCPVGVNLAARMKRRMMALRLVLISLVSGILLLPGKSNAEDTILGGAIEVPNETPPDAEPEEKQREPDDESPTSETGYKGTVYLISRSGRPVKVVTMVLKRVRERTYQVQSWSLERNKHTKRLRRWK